ncbi:hypothetical protein AYO39_01185 [Actinobacteria bacterium SCGC AG-212-D09]|nr:hypothetical protein AYO39_01185 [Actinobacteria bacterium SCGC AG-212-D09]
MPLKHEKFVAKVRDRNAQQLEEGEQIERSVGGQTGRIHLGPLLNLIDAGRRFAGKLETRLIVLTNRNVYVAYPGFFGQFEMKAVKAKFPRNEAAAHLRLGGRGDELDVDGEHIYFRLGTMKHVRDLVEAATGRSAESEG